MRISAPLSAPSPGKGAPHTHGTQSRASISPRPPLVEECGRGEDGAVGNNLPRYIHELLEHQLEEIGISRTQLRDFGRRALHAS